MGGLIFTDGLKKSKECSDFSEVKALQGRLFYSQPYFHPTPHLLNPFHLPKGLDPGPGVVPTFLSLFRRGNEILKTNPKPSSSNSIRGVLTGTPRYFYLFIFT